MIKTQPEYDKMAQVFGLRYTDREGQLVEKVVEDWELAKQLARELAQASGRRAVIFRRPAYAWDVYVIDQEGARELAWSGLTKREVIERWKRWRPRRTGCVLVAYPDWWPVDSELSNATARP